MHQQLFATLILSCGSTIECSINIFESIWDEYNTAVEDFSITDRTTGRTCKVDPQAYQEAINDVVAEHITLSVLLAYSQFNTGPCIDWEDFKKISNAWLPAGVHIERIVDRYLFNLDLPDSVVVDYPATFKNIATSYVEIDGHWFDQSGI